MKAIEIIKNKRIKKGINQRELSEILNLPINAWQKIESGTQSLKLEDFLKIIKYLEIPITAFNDEQLIVISENDLKDLSKASELLNNVTSKISEASYITIGDNNNIQIGNNNRGK